MGKGQRAKENTNGMIELVTGQAQPLTSRFGASKRVLQLEESVCVVLVKGTALLGGDEWC